MNNENDNDPDTFDSVEWKPMGPGEARKLPAGWELKTHEDGSKYAYNPLIGGVTAHEGKMSAIGCASIPLEVLFSVLEANDMMPRLYESTSR